MMKNVKKIAIAMAVALITAACGQNSEPNIAQVSAILAEYEEAVFEYDLENTWRSLSTRTQNEISKDTWSDCVATGFAETADTGRTRFEVDLISLYEFEEQWLVDIRIEFTTDTYGEGSDLATIILHQESDGSWKLGRNAYLSHRLRRTGVLALLLRHLTEDTDNGLLQVRHLPADFT